MTAAARWRTGLLLLALGVTALWAAGRVQGRRARASWERPVTVAVLLLGDAPPGAPEALAARLEALAARLEEDRAALAPGGPAAPLAFTVIGPVHPERLPPTAPPGPGWGDRALHALEVWRAARAAHAAAPGFEPDAADVRVYLVAAPRGEGGGRVAEGLGEAGGEVGVVRASLEGDDALLAAFTVAHEALHCLGATDKYDEAGHARLPQGLAEPWREPPLPQRRAEIMVGEVPLAPGLGRLPGSPEEIGVGPATAAEIGWVAGR